MELIKDIVGEPSTEQEPVLKETPRKKMTKKMRNKYNQDLQHFIINNKESLPELEAQLSKKKKKELYMTDIIEIVSKLDNQ